MAESERPREKLIKFGVSVLSNAELLAILIRTGTKETSAIELAQKILSISHSGLRYLADCTIEELSEIKGIAKVKACQIVAAIELGKRLAMSNSKAKLNIRSSRDVANVFMEEMRYYKKEYFKSILLNTKNEIIITENISIGSLNSSLVHPREVFVSAIRKSASSIILIHNHPSGNPDPSNEDIKITKRLIEAGKIIGIEILDHIIIGDGNYLSLKEISII
ncbi:RadC family protein [Marinisporobacter balticus]|nr:DNA repair protein RadC [Marinisporobacter balticus]